MILAGGPLGESDSIGDIAGNEKLVTAPDVITFKFPPSDTEIAAGYREQARAHLEVLIILMNNMDKDGMRLSFNLGRDAFGRNAVLALDIVKVL